MRHYRAVAEDLRGESFLTEQVSCQLQAVFVAEILNLLHIRGGEQVGDQLPEAEARFFVIPDGVEKLGQVGENVIAVSLLVFCGDDGTFGHSALQRGAWIYGG